MIHRQAAIKDKEALDAGEDSDDEQEEEELDNQDEENGQEKSSNAKRKDVLPDLEYTGEQIMELGEEDTSGGVGKEYKLTEEEHIKRYVWLASWFLQGVVSAETWKEEVIGTIRYKNRRNNITEWMTSSDMAYLCNIYIHSYDKWKKEAEMKMGRPTGKLSKEEHKALNKMGKYQPDGISSDEGKKKLKMIQKHYGFKIVSVKKAQEKFCSDFWTYYDETVVPIVQPDKGENNTVVQECSLEYRNKLEEEKREEEENDLLWTK